jgi:hypothetical protein
MQRQRAAKAQKEHYPTLWPKWIRNATRARLGLPLERVPKVGRWDKTRELETSEPEPETPAVVVFVGNQAIKALEAP